MPGVSSEHSPQLLDHFRVDVAEVLVVGQCSEEIQLDLLLDRLQQISARQSSVSVNG